MISHALAQASESAVPATNFPQLFTLVAIVAAPYIAWKVLKMWIASKRNKNDDNQMSGPAPK